MGKRIVAAVVVATLGVMAISATASPRDSNARGSQKVLCWNHSYPEGGPPDFFSAPKRCSLFRDGYDYEAAGAVHLRKLHWKHWGAKTAVAKGEYAQPMDVDDPWKPIKVRLKRSIEDCGRTVYSKATFHTKGGDSGFPIWTC